MSANRCGGKAASVRRADADTSAENTLAMSDCIQKQRASGFSISTRAMIKLRVERQGEGKGLPDIGDAPFGGAHVLPPRRQRDRRKP